jgi:hypothetical protein
VEANNNNNNNKVEISHEGKEQFYEIDKYKSAEPAIAINQKS